MRSFVLPAPIRLIIAIAVAIVLCTWIDPYVDIGDSLTVQLVNAALPVLLMLLVWGLSGRLWLALVLEAAVLGVACYADHMKVMYLDSNLVYADLTVVSGLLKDPQLVLGFIHPSTWMIVGGVAVVFAAVLVAWFTRRWRTASAGLRITCLALALVGFAVAWTQRAPDVVEPLHWEVFTQVEGAKNAGITGNILLGRMTARDVNRRSDAKAEQAFWREPLVQKFRQQLQEGGDGRQPDILFIQSESLFEPSQLCGFADTPLLTHVAQQKPALPGNLEVPVFGGRTLQTEFEALTGAPISFYRGSMFSYYELMGHRIDALPSVLDRNGYNTIAMHPNNRGFWRRGVVMPEMGFATFQDIDSFIAPRDFSERHHVSDAALTRAILAELDSASRPTFVMAISMDNHGPWGQFAPKDESGLGLPDGLTGEARSQMADYVAHAIDADKAYGFLLDALQRRGRPTIVVFYGDHLPALPAVYKQLCFKDGKEPAEHLPPYRVWANFPVPVAPDVTSSYLLQGWVMRAAGLPLQGHVLANAIAGMVAADVAVDPADRDRILGEYANIAAANVAAKAPTTGPATVYINSDKALDMLMDKQLRTASPAAAEVRNGDLFLKEAAGTSS